MNSRPLGVTVLAVLAGLVAVLAGIHALQSLGILPFFIGPFAIHGFSFWSFLMWALLAWVWFWVARMLWEVDKQGWLFLTVVTLFNLIVDFAVMLGASTWSDVSVGFIVSALILIYIMLPGVRQSFDVN